MSNQGVVKFYDETKGFGFILNKSDGKEYFVHATGLVHKIQKDDEVSFEITEGRKGLNATGVKLI